MNDFTASNGVIVREHPGAIGIRRSVEDMAPVPVPGFTRPERVQTYLDPRQWDAVAEAVQAEADERLGRWRWPENPDYVVKIDPLGARLAHVLHEPSLATAVVHPVAPYGLGGERDREFTLAARAYFGAHPEPKPWDEANEGEIWALTGAGGLEQPWRRHEGKWISCTPSLRTYDAAHAIAGRCIWSEVSNGD